MSVDSLVQARINGAVKEEAAAVLASFGLTVPDVVRLLLTRIATEHTLPFDPLIPNAETVEAMKEARQGGLESFESIDALMADLNAND
uniref:DNA-damage-inducible protein J n=1 Tax=Candidatus Kentrum sp. MB TaxID=2138164 RepID=A0A451B814_9GAMM|nr:MAG: DNA-damage-inducible protein J [Candidatus Kentron sp. MB]VFK27776.1 MAG: DNA-damage-inducible protein J [Candidatus Kentron sp. MB]VFK74430.1 MAG: DNA-damage-inducible protein J [Candidatus Kentron sp. MB]